MPREDRIMPITYMKNRAADLVREVSESGSSVVITQNGEAKVVVMGMKAYNRWRDAMALLKILSHAQSDVEADRLVSQDEAFARAMAKIESAEEQ